MDFEFLWGRLSTCGGLAIRLPRLSYPPEERRLLIAAQDAIQDAIRQCRTNRRKPAGPVRLLDRIRPGLVDRSTCFKGSLEPVGVQSTYGQPRIYRADCAGNLTVRHAPYRSRTRTSARRPTATHSAVTWKRFPHPEPAAAGDGIAASHNGHLIPNPNTHAPPVLQFKRLVRERGVQPYWRNDTCRGCPYRDAATP